MTKSVRFVAKKTDAGLIEFFAAVADAVGASFASILINGQDRGFGYEFKSKENSYHWIETSDLQSIASISIGSKNVNIAIERRPDQLKDVAVDLSMFDPLVITAERIQPNSGDVGLDSDALHKLNILISAHYGTDTNLASAAFKDPKSFQAVLRSHQQMIERLQQMTLQVGEQAADARRKLDNEYTEMKRQLEEQVAAERLETQKANDAERATLSQRADAISERARSLDDRNNTHVRRELFEKTKSLLSGRFKKLDLTPETKKARWPIHIGVAVSAIILGLLIYYFTLEALAAMARSDSGTAERILAIAKSATASLGFLGIISWYLRWMNRWFERLADSEFQLKQFELDITRAQWVVETAFEWKMSQQSPIPDQLLENISRNLFVDKEKDDGADMHPADYLASALIGKASNVKLAVPGAEIELGPKALKAAAS